MGKGGGCVPSKNHRLPRPAAAPLPPSHRRPRTFIPPASPRPVRIYVVFYSMYGHVQRLARAVQRGVGTVPGARALLFRVPETLPPGVLARMGAADRANEDIPVVDPDGLPDADGFLFGFPARYGAMAAQMQAFFDSTEPLCRHQRLAGKPAGFFVSTGTQCGGQETTAWTAITQLAHHGMMFVPIGYTFGDGMFEMEELRGGSPYGAGVFSGDGSRPPSELELALAEHHGKYMATLVKRMVHGVTQSKATDFSIILALLLTQAFLRALRLKPRRNPLSAALSGRHLMEEAGTASVVASPCTTAATLSRQPGRRTWRPGSSGSTARWSATA